MHLLLAEVLSVNLSVVVGNPKPASRTLMIAEAVADRVVAATGSTKVISVDLVCYAAEMFEWPSDRLASVNDAVAQTDILVVASPTYKGTYTGLLKAFLDRYPNNGLAGVTAIPIMTAGSPLHGMAVEVGLRTLLVELGASVPTRGLCFLMSQMPDMDSVLNSWIADNIRPDGGTFGPLNRPIAP
jgi:FMN reductase